MEFPCSSPYNALFCTCSKNKVDITPVFCPHPSPPAQKANRFGVGKKWGGDINRAADLNHMTSHSALKGGKRKDWGGGGGGRRVLVTKTSVLPNNH